MELQSARPVTPETSEVLALVLETALDGVIVMGTDGLVVDWNRQAELIFGWRRDQAVGRLLADLVIPEAQRPAHRDGLNRFLVTGEGPLLHRRIEVLAVRKSGETFPIELSISPVAADGATLFLGFTRDISERRRHEDALKLQAREAELLHQVTTRAAETESLDEILQLCLDSVCELTGWPVGHAYLPEHSEPLRLRPSAIWHGELDRFASLKKATEASVFAPGEGLPGRIWASQEPEWVPDIRKENALPRLRLVGDDVGVESAFGFPIVSGGEVAAILEFFSQEPAQPDARLLHIARVLGHQVGRVLERQAERRRQALLLAELDHRAKNMLAVVMSIAHQTAKRAHSVESFEAAFSARLVALARGYGLVTAGGWRTTSLAELVRTIAEPYVAGDGQLQAGGDPVFLPPKAALALTMILHELLANAAKYGALATSSGRIDVSWSRTAGPVPRVILEWRETGLADVEAPVGSGFGTRLIEASVKLELGGDIETAFTPNGVHYRFDFPAPDREGAP